MTLFEFMDNSPVTTVIVGFMVLVCLTSVVLCVVSHIQGVLFRFLRSRNISKHGWPPPHCDSDGSFCTPMDFLKQLEDNETVEKVLDQWMKNRERRREEKL